MQVRVLFVCLGNICRSPTAEGIFTQTVKNAGLDKSIVVDSAGTGDWHIGLPPDKRAIIAAGERDVDLTGLRARQVSSIDFASFDYVLAMDDANLRDLKIMQPSDFTGHLSLFLSFAENTKTTEVPDPYYGGEEGFTQVFDLIAEASEGLLNHIKNTHLS